VAGGILLSPSFKIFSCKNPFPAGGLFSFCVFFVSELVFPLLLLALPRSVRSSSLQPQRCPPGRHPFFALCLVIIGVRWVLFGRVWGGVILFVPPLLVRFKVFGLLVFSF